MADTEPTQTYVYQPIYQPTHPIENSTIHGATEVGAFYAVETTRRTVVS